MTNTRKPGVFQRFSTAFRVGSRVFRAAGTETLADLDRRMDEAISGRPSITGVNVTAESALNFTAYFSGVMQIAQTIGSCRCELFKRLEKRRRIPWDGHPVRELLTGMANPYTDAYHFREVLQHHALSFGNGYAYIQRDQNANPAALWQLLPGMMSIEVLDSGVPVYKYSNPKTGAKDVFQWDEIFHIAGFGGTGLEGYSLIQLFREAIGLGLTQQEFSERFINNGVSTSGVLEHQGKLSPEARADLQKQIQNKYSGLQNAGRFLVLQEGMKFTSRTMPLADAQFLESRVFSVQEMARILNIPTPKLKDYTKLTYTNAEQLFVEFRTDTIRPWAERWEIAIDTQLLNRSQRKKGFAQFNLNAISRGDIKTESEANKNYRYAGIYSANDVLERAGENPLEDEKVGNMIWMPTNMMDASNPQPVNTKGNSDEEVVQD